MASSGKASIWFGIAAGAVAIHGLIEVAAALPLLVPGITIPEFAFEELSRFPQATYGVGIVVGLLRLAAAGGLIARRAWGWVLAAVLSALTFSMLTFYLPAGFSDAVLAGTALLCLIIGRWPGRLTTDIITAPGGER